METGERLRLTKEGMKNWVRIHCREIRRIVKDAGENPFELLNKREIKIVKMRMGNHTLQEAANELGVTRSRAKIIQDNAIRKIKKKVELEKLIW